MLSLLDIQNLPDPFLTEFIITLKMSSFFFIIIIIKAM